jgi:hypothetical protein
VRLADKKKGKRLVGLEGYIPPIAKCAMDGAPDKRKAKADPPPAAKDDNQKTKAIGEKSWRSRGGWLEFVEGFGVGVEDHVG